MKKLFVDHIVISVQDLDASKKFYEVFLGKAKVNKWDIHWIIGNTKLFLTSAYKKNPRKFDKHNFGLNHLAFGLRDLKEIKAFEKKLVKANIVNSGIKIDQYSEKEFIWFDDLDGIRLEFYLRP